MTRLDGWPLRVRAVLKQWAAKETRGAVSWGQDDCIQLGLDVARAISGKDPVPEMRASYATYADGYRQMRRAFIDVVAVLDARTSQRIDLDQARLGDIALSGAFEHGQPVIHIFLRKGRKVTFSAKGLEDTSPTPVEGVWRL